MDLDIKTLRTVWNFVEAANPHTLVKLSDGELIQKLLEQIKSEMPLSSENNQTLSKYIGSRTPLIRELAYAKIC